MSAVTTLVEGLTTSLQTEIIAIVTALAVIVGIAVLVKYGFRKLSSIGAR